MFIGRTDAEAPILWPPHVKTWHIGKDPDAGKDWGQEKGTTEDEMVGWHHQLDGHEFGWTPELVIDGQGGLACCSPWGLRVRHDWATELNWRINKYLLLFTSVNWGYMKLSNVIFYMKHLFLNFSDRIKPKFYLYFKMHKMPTYSFMQFATATTNPCCVSPGLACCRWEFNHLFQFHYCFNHQCKRRHMQLHRPPEAGSAGGPGAAPTWIEQSSPEDTAGVRGGGGGSPPALSAAQQELRKGWVNGGVSR